MSSDPMIQVSGFGDEQWGTVSASVALSRLASDLQHPGPGVQVAPETSVEVALAVSGVEESSVVSVTLYSRAT